MLAQVAIFLAAAIVMVPIARRFGLGAVLGYLAAGVLIGPWGMRLIDGVETTLSFGEFGVELMLFVIGLELQPQRLWVLRRLVFGLGGAQVLLTAVLVGGAALWLGLSWQAGVVVGLALAMSSTALVLQTLAEKHQLTDRHGRNAFAILLFQDLSVIPILALLPLLGGESTAGSDWHDALRGVAVIVGVIWGGRTLLRPALKWIATSGARESFTAAALFVVVGVTLLMEYAGLTASLGAFLAGMLLADSEYRHELEADIEPFKGLFLGLFFIAIGMSANVGLLLSQPLSLLAGVVGFMAIKFAALYLIGRVAGGARSAARRLAISLAQGGEFAFVLFALGRNHGVLSEPQAAWLVMVVTLSMLCAPLLFVLEEKLLTPWFDRDVERPFDAVADPGRPVIIAGFGRVGQIVSRLLALRRIPFTVLDASAQQVDFVRRFGNKVYYGDASRLDVLMAAGIDKARLFVLAIDDVEASIKTAELVRAHFPKLPIYARARNRFHAYKLMDIGVEALVRETFFSSTQLGRDVLRGLDVPAQDVDVLIERFIAHDEQSLRRQHAVYQDEAALIQTSRQAAAELRGLFEEDAAAQRIAQPADPARAGAPS
ncbi:monovalent cation:proton antiporter-2 (CPA2) family protein [Uliginosibacterium sp. sgz301328]|uniref:monovalent cation:proton antiporter-2 (CPA2) family protein n=1 Tax=Uliginosibacterium sp. sgz301328 TaxID=3243764 RepID=UPI00359CF50E